MKYILSVFLIVMSFNILAAKVECKASNKAGEQSCSCEDLSDDANKCACFKAVADLPNGKVVVIDGQKFKTRATNK